MHSYPMAELAIGSLGRKQSLCIRCVVELGGALEEFQKYCFSDKFTKQVFIHEATIIN